MGHEILFGALSFIANDLAWLQDTPLDIETLPSRGATHFRASSCGVLLLQPSTPVSIFSPVTRRNKRSGRSRLQHWVRHALARQNMSSQVAVLESVVVPRSSLCLESVPTELPSDYQGHGPAAEVLMANSHESPSETGRNGREIGESSGAHRQHPRSSSRRTR